MSTSVSTPVSTPLCMPTVFLNGEYMPIEDAKISPLDRGFIFGDGVYEVIPYYNGRGLRAREHLVRLQRSMDALYMSNPYSIEKWESVIAGLIAKNGGGNVGVYIQVTRGIAKRDFPPPQGLSPTIFLMVNSLPTPKPEVYERGISGASIDDSRWLRCHIKSTALLGAVLLKHESSLDGDDEAVMFRDGYLTESSASNIAAVKDGIILCPPMDNLILGGITYVLMIELARRAGIPLEVRRVLRREVETADELWIMSSTKEVVPIVTLDKRPVGRGANAGKPGPLFKKMYQLFQDYKREQPPATLAAAAE
ncbi:MAG: D-amino acid aminotransferase [Pseudomonadota bacterium]